MNKNLIIAHGGGPTAVINASLYGAVREAQKQGCFGKILGAVHGIEGVFSETFIDLGQLSDAQIELLPHTPSSAIGSCRRKLKNEDYPQLLDIFRRNEIGYFIYNGGNDSMDTCQKISDLAKASGYDLCVAGIPKTIDNDLGFMDFCPGYGSAARFIAANTRDLWCEEHALPIYPMIIETMGRNAGWITAAASLAQMGGKPCADLIYLPEYSFNEEAFLGDMERCLSGSGSNAVIAVVCEGLADDTGKPIADTGFVDGFGHSVPGGTAQTLAKIVLDKLGVQTRYEKLGLVGRASAVWQSAVDRDVAIECGRQAILLLAEGKSGYMVTTERTASSPYACSYGTIPLGEVANIERKFPLEWINAERNGICGGFRDYCMPLIGDPFTEYACMNI